MKACKLFSDGHLYPQSLDALFNYCLFFTFFINIPTILISDQKRMVC